MTNRKRAPPQKLITAALPPRPNASILLGEDRYGEADVYGDLLAYGMVVGPREEAAAAGTRGRWELAWRGAPLVVYDTGLVEAIGAMAPDLMDVAGNITIAAIGRILDEHPGPVGCLRLESPSGCPLPDVIAGWMDRLRATKGEDGLRELVVVNMNWPKNKEDDGEPKDKEDGEPKNACFPLHRLPCGLRSLSLCWFEMSPLEGDRLAGLTELRLTGCNFRAQGLSEVIAEMYYLRKMVVGHCRLTSGCGPLTIVSPNLRHLEMLACTASGGISLHYTPRLLFLCTDVRPQDCDARILIDIRMPAALRELHGMMMNWHDLSYVTPVNCKFNGIRIAPLPNLSILRVGLQMSTPEQLLELLHLLVHMICLKHLTIMRVDNPHQNEEFTAGKEAFAAICIANTLKELVLDHFKGGAAELRFAIGFLATAASLTSLNLKPHGALSDIQAADVGTLLMNCTHASADCQIQLFD